MDKAIKGYEYFREHVFPKYKEFFALLAQGQNPDTFFVRCSDSRVCLWKMLGIEPGDGFVSSNPGNVVPPWNAVLGGEQASVEYAVLKLKVRHIVVLGHTECGAMGALLNGPESVRDELPALSNMLCMCRTNHLHPAVSSSPNPTRTLAELHIKQQMTNLDSYPFVHERRLRGELDIHGWLFNIADAQMLKYDQVTDTFVHLI